VNARGRRDAQAAAAPRRAAIAIMLAGVSLQGCVVLPATLDTFDNECQVVSHHIVLQAVQIAEINRCANQGCAALVIGAAATAAATAIVSGSIMVVGNVGYWIERQANCRSPANAVVAPG
jgi:hypothetical protein